MTIMDHQIIDSEGMVERYVTGRLDAETEARFEEHYLDCPRCVAAVEDAEQLARGLAAIADQATSPERAASEDGAVEVPASASQAPVVRTMPVPARKPVTGRWLALAAVLALAVLGGLLWQAQRISELETRLAAAQAPQLVASIIELGSLRAEGAEQRLRLGAEREQLVFTVPVPFGDGSFRLRLVREEELEDGNEIWQTDAAAAGADGRIAFSLDSQLLVPGRYRLLVEDAAGYVALDQRLMVEAP